MEIVQSISLFFARTRYQIVKREEKRKSLRRKIFGLMN
jgi:hypothetical protein